MFCYCLLLTLYCPSGPLTPFNLLEKKKLTPYYVYHLFHVIKIYMVKNVPKCDHIGGGSNFIKNIGFYGEDSISLNKKGLL